MEFVILGLLLIRSLSQYDIKAILERKISPFYSPSLGSIQAALKKLQARGLTQLQADENSPRGRKLYTITAEGKQHFMTWMLAPFSHGRLEQEATTKLFFLGLVSPAERLAIVREMTRVLEANVQEYETAYTEANTRMGSGGTPVHLAEVARFQLKTLELGLHDQRSMLAWFTSLAEELEAETDG
ncbi:PadR family transcriptional regulator [Paenibacillus tarimensis]|uniref:PadR family transcriptional regulator n=1 Tax=Paenibacillus tarimensis TaxID=416012 RepID=UPI001F228A53|nr:helix-turn-helix transcriptional regulator [Paenibacillus tarimensis]MCF2945304.1 PadR family transcriptional regulator [Paenibacillus tarimensis]